MNPDIEATNALRALLPTGLFEALSAATPSAGLVWLAALLTFALLVQPNPLTRLRTLDLLSLVVAGLSLLLRDDDRIVAAGRDGHWYAQLVLVVVTLYWAVRGIALASARNVPLCETTATPRMLSVLLLAGLATASVRVALGPITEGAHDGLVGGIHLAETGRLPYGDRGGIDDQSPLLYGAFAGAAQLVALGDGGALPEAAIGASEFSDATLLTTQVVCLTLFLLMFAGVVALGARLHSFVMGQTLGVVLCLLPTVIDVIYSPQWTLPAALLIWTAFFATLPGIGGLLALLTISLAGLAWPWAWLLIPVLLGYFASHRWSILGATLGLLAGAAAVVALAGLLTAPSLPRADGALARAGWQPEVIASAGPDDTIVITPYDQDDGRTGDFKAGLWRAALEREGVTLADVEAPIVMPNGRDKSQVLLARVTTADPDVHARLQAGYRDALGRGSQATELIAALRSVVEATYAPRTLPGDAAGDHWTWLTQTLGLGEDALRWTRRGFKLLVGLLALAIGFGLSRQDRAERREGIGALLAITAAGVLAAAGGLGGGLVLAAPLVLATFALHGERTRPVRPGKADVARRRLQPQPAPPPPQGHSPRISVN